MDLKEIYRESIYKNSITLITAFILNCTLSILNLVTPLIIGKYIDSLNFNKDISKVIDYSVCFGVIFSIVLLSNYIIKILNFKTASKMYKTLSEQIYTKILVSVDTPLPREGAYVAKRVSEDINTTISFIINTLMIILIKLVQIVFITIVMFRISYHISIVMIVISGINIFIYKSFKKIIYKRQKGYLEAQTKFFSKQSNMISSTISIKRNKWNDEFLDKYEKDFDEYFYFSFKNMKSQLNYNATGMGLDSLSNILLFFMCGLSIIKNSLSIGEFTVLNSYKNSFSEVINSLMSLGQSYQNFKVSYNRLLEFYNKESENSNTGKIANIEEIELKDLTFSISDKCLINRMNYTFKKDSIYCLIGANGAGKTTLLDILIGIYPSYNGQVLYNNSEVKELDYYYLRKRYVGYVEQQPIILEDNFINNLLIGNEGCEPQLVEYYVNKFFDKKEAERLYKLKKLQNISGGEMQKINLIRVFLKQPKIYLFDEPTVALDQKSVESFIECLEEIKKDNIVILISHDKTLIDRVDNQIIIKNI